jgi:hypothetical protein
MSQIKRLDEQQAATPAKPVRNNASPRSAEMVAFVVEADVQMQRLTF